MSTYKSVHLACRPKGRIEPSNTFQVKNHATPSTSDLEEGQILVRVHYLSVDPAMRSWLDDKRSYHTPVQIGEVMHGFGIGIVEASRSDRFSTSSYVIGPMGWSEIAQMHQDQLQPIHLEPWTKVTDWLGILGFTGMTAYFGMTDVADVKPGDLVVVTGAAGATGSIAGQIAKMKGARVVGIAGSDDKCRWLVDELGFDEALNYKADSFAKDFIQSTKDLIDVFFDNVGGPILDQALMRAKAHARFVMCGAVSQHNDDTAYGLKNYLMITRMRINMQGFIIFDFKDRFDEARQFLSDGLKKGQLRSRESIVEGGLSKAGEALASLYSGSNTGKLLVKVNE
ncbi:hypothetical protein FSARC_10581 [Fusarium sarcochroum]|uniref:Dehydrogenase FUB6 n=1 Tax=Fusarium sarcochroum TaxID=1208366 RepID=A0A8H4X3I1_9HYPO|nr:hypothetical protein FSARC_10581 [Fusarium sarcochroum]